MSKLMRDELREAIRLRLRADVPVACYLSGGLDSCAILGIAADLREDPIESFTIAFEEGPFDEGPIAEEMAARAGSNFHRFRMHEETLAEHWEAAIAHCEMITWNANACAKYVLSRHVRDSGFKVVLTGEGADELLGGYPFFRADMLRHDTEADASTTEARLAALREGKRAVWTAWTRPHRPDARARRRSRRRSASSRRSSRILQRVAYSCSAYCALTSRSSLPIGIPTASS